MLNKIVEKSSEENKLMARIESVTAENDFTKEQLSALKAKYENIKNGEISGLLKPMKDPAGNLFFFLHYFLLIFLLSFISHSSVGILAAYLILIFPMHMLKINHLIIVDLNICEILKLPYHYRHGYYEHNFIKL